METAIAITKLPEGMGYQWRPVPGIEFVGDANEIGRHLEELAEEKGGIITTRDIVDDAQNIKSPLHPNIEWDDKVAADRWRNWQARCLAGSLVRVAVQHVGENSREITVRGFVNVSVDGHRGYSPMSFVLSDGALTDQYVKQLEQQLISWGRKASDFDEFASIVRAIDIHVNNRLPKPKRKKKN